DPALAVVPLPQPSAVVLAIGDVVAAPAPGIEQPGPFARAAIEKPAGKGEALAPARDRAAGFLDQVFPLAPAAGLARRRAQDARWRQQARPPVLEAADRHQPPPRLTARPLTARPLTARPP